MINDIIPTLIIANMRDRGRQLDITANNIANASTNGFRAQISVFSEYITFGEANSISFPFIHSNTIDEKAGVVEGTGRDFDIAISGEGFFVIEGNNEQLITRSGAFYISKDGFIVDALGRKFVDAEGGAIAVPSGASVITVASDGTVSADAEVIGRISVVAAPLAGLERREGASIFVPSDLEPVEVPVILQGALERSNVQIVLEVADVIEITRAYERGQKFLDREDSRVRNFIETLSR